MTWLLPFTFCLSFGTTVAEPALIAVAAEAADVVAAEGFVEANNVAKHGCALGLRLTVALSVGALGVGVFRIFNGWPSNL